jgi:hypothetical protein
MDDGARTADGDVTELATPLVCRSAALEHAEIAVATNLLLVCSPNQAAACVGGGMRGVRG